MFDLDRWKEIWETIARNRKRSIMTGLGVFWGIFMFTVMMGFGMWLGRTALSSLGSYSTNTTYFFTDQTSIPYQGMPSGRWWNFDMHDLEAIRQQVPDIKYAAAMNWGGSQKVSHNERKGEYYLMGYTPDFQKINPQPLKFGRFINQPDMEGKRKVCVIGGQIWKELFPGGENPVGEVIKMNDLYLTVVGVMERGSTSINIGSNPETTIAVPNSLVQQLWNEGSSVDMITIMAEDDVRIQDIEEKCKRIIAANHIISPDDKKAISGFNLGEQFEKVNGLLNGISLLTWIVGLGDAAGRHRRRQQHHARHRTGADAGDRRPPGDRRPAVVHHIADSLRKFPADLHRRYPRPCGRSRSTVGIREADSGHDGAGERHAAAADIFRARHHGHPHHHRRKLAGRHHPGQPCHEDKGGGCD